MALIILLTNFAIKKSERKGWADHLGFLFSSSKYHSVFHSCQNRQQDLRIFMLFKKRCVPLTSPLLFSTSGIFTSDMLKAGLAENRVA